MKLPEDSKKQIVLFAVLLLVLFIIIFIFDVISKKSSNKVIKTVIDIKNISPTTQQNNNSTEPSVGKNNLLPTYPSEKGKGVDLESPKVSSSIQEIQKLYIHLPYIFTFKTTTNKEVSIVIPDKDAQINSWTLTVHIYDLNYRLEKKDVDYSLMKSSFIETSQFIKNWIEEKGVNFNKIMINWGDREYIQNKSQEWLNN